MPALPILDLDQPDVGIKLDLARKIGIYICFAGARLVHVRRPLALELAFVEPGGRRPEQAGGSIQPAHLDEDRAGIVIAMPHDDGGRAGTRARPEIGFDPDFGLETHEATAKSRARNVQATLLRHRFSLLTRGRFRQLGEHRT